MLDRAFHWLISTQVPGVPRGLLRRRRRPRAGPLRPGGRPRRRVRRRGPRAGARRAARLPGGPRGVPPPQRQAVPREPRRGGPGGRAAGPGARRAGRAGAARGDARGAAPHAARADRAGLRRAARARGAGVQRDRARVKLGLAVYSSTARLVAVLVAAPPATRRSFVSRKARMLMLGPKGTSPCSRARGYGRRAAGGEDRRVGRAGDGVARLRERRQGTPRSPGESREPRPRRPDKCEAASYQRAYAFPRPSLLADRPCRRVSSGSRGPWRGKRARRGTRRRRST